MHNSLTRLQTAFGYLTSCAFFLALLISALSLVPLPLPTTSSSASFSTATNTAPTATISARNIQVVRGRPHYYSSKREEYAHVRFDLEADLSGLFNWNTKQVFVYVNAEYPAEPAVELTGSEEDGSNGSLSREGRGAGMNKAVIWDMIIPAPASEWSFANVWQRYFSAKKGGKAAKKSTSSKSNKAKTTTTDMTKPGLLVLKNQKPKYQITDPSGVISSRPNATLTVSWNVQPRVGPLLWDRGMLEEKNGGPGGAKGSWNLPFLRYQWRAGVLPRSQRFDFPPLKGAQKTSEVVKDKEGPKTPEPAEASGVV